jgi:pilus assembly protein CpaB
VAAASHPQATMRRRWTQNPLWTTEFGAPLPHTVISMVNRFAPALASWTRAVSWHRRLLAAAAAATAIVFVLEALQPSAPAMKPVLIASRDLAGGAALRRDDVQRIRRPADTVPSGAVSNLGALPGRPLAAPMREGEVLTDVRMLGPPLIAANRGKVATPVRLADPGIATLLRVGDRVNVLGVPQAADGTTLGMAEVIASDVAVLAVPEPTDADTVTTGALVVLAATPSDAQALAGVAVTSHLTVTILPT